MCPGDSAHVSLSPSLIVRLSANATSLIHCIWFMARRIHRLWCRLCVRLCRNPLFIAHCSISESHKLIAFLMLRWQTRLEEHGIDAVLRAQQWIIAVHACKVRHSCVPSIEVISARGQRFGLFAFLTTARNAHAHLCLGIRYLNVQRLVTLMGGRRVMCATRKFMAMSSQFMPSST